MADRRCEIAGAYAGGGDASAPGASAVGGAGWLSLAAAPTFAIMALLAGTSGDASPDMLCSAAHHAAPLSGMVPMYVLMSVFHAAPWLRLIVYSRRRGR
jgi:hypothetical protein